MMLSNAQSPAWGGYMEGANALGDLDQIVNWDLMPTMEAVNQSPDVVMLYAIIAHFMMKIER